MRKANKATRSKKSYPVTPIGIVKIYCSFNNTRITITDLEGKVLGWNTAGMHYKGARKSTPFAAGVAASIVCEFIKNNFKMRSVDVSVKGPGPGREGAIRVLDKFFKVTSINDITGIPHNGCRSEKERRV